VDLWIVVDAYCFKNKKEVFGHVGCSVILKFQMSRVWRTQGSCCVVLLLLYII
jgi:hypothetical protein